MKKTTKEVKTAHDSKGFLALTGEAFHVLGEEIIDGKDKLVEATSEKFTAVKKAIGKIIHKKAAPKARTARKVVRKAAGKVAKKVTAPKRKR